MQNSPKLKRSKDDVIKNFNKEVQSKLKARAARPICTDCGHRPADIGELCWTCWKLMEISE